MRVVQRERACDFAWLGCANYRWTESPRGPTRLRGAPQSLNTGAHPAFWKVRAEGQEDTVLWSLLGLNVNFKQEQKACVDLCYHSFMDWGTEVWRDSDLSSFESPSIFLFLKLTDSGMWSSWGGSLRASWSEGGGVSPTFR